MELQVTKHGSYDIRALHDFLNAASDGVYNISVKRSRHCRSNNQNAYLWGVAYPILLTSMVREGWELTSVNEVHGIFKHLLTSRKVINRHTGEVVEFPASTAYMNTVEFTSYVDQIRKYAREYLNTEIPDPQ